MSRMSRTKYRVACRRLNAAYLALKAAADTAEWSAQYTLGAALDAMRKAPDALRVQVCRDCGPNGYYTAPDDPYTSLSCHHPTVPHYDVRTDSWELPR